MPHLAQNICIHDTTAYLSMDFKQWLNLHLGRWLSSPFNHKHSDSELNNMFMLFLGPSQFWSTKRVLGIPC